MPNYFISYDLKKPGQNYEKVADAIKQTGQWAKVQLSLWYVKSSMTAEQIAKHVWQHMDANDSLVVIDSSNNEAYWFNLDTQVSTFMQQQWR